MPTIFSLWLAAALTVCSTPAFANDKEDRVWVDYKLSSVYRVGLEKSLTNMKIKLKRELELVPESHAREYKSILEGFCVRIRKIVNEKGYIDDSTSEDYDRCLRYERLTNSPELPRALALKLFDSLKELGKRGYVLVESGAYSDGKTTNVMTEKNFALNASEGLGHNLVAYGDVKYEFQGKKYKIDIDLYNAVRFLEFSDKYDAETRTWSPKFAEGSLQSLVIKKTQYLIKTHETINPSFNHAGTIHYHISKNMDSIIEEAQGYEQFERQSYVKNRVQDIVTAILTTK